MKVAAILLIPLMVAGALIYSYASDRTAIDSKREYLSRDLCSYGIEGFFQSPGRNQRDAQQRSPVLIIQFLLISDRKVKLEGEAWFEVSSDEEPF